MRSPAFVIAGLDPAIHPLRKNFFRWMRGSSPRMTTQEDNDHNPAAILAKRSQAAKAQLPRQAPPLSMGHGERAAKRVHDRASGTWCKARVVAFPCFRPVPSCYRRQGETTEETPPARISAFRTTAYGTRETPGCGRPPVFPCYLQEKTGPQGSLAAPRASPSHVADAAVHHYLYAVSAGLA
jgi:hypothetical protein